MAKVRPDDDNFIEPEIRDRLPQNAAGKGNGGVQMDTRWSRRAFGCAIATIVIDRVFAAPAGIGELPAKPMMPGELLPLPGASAEGALSSGADSATTKELAIAKRVLDTSPSTINPYEVAQYFDRVGRGLENPAGEDWTPYVREWPERYNPVILNFFNATTVRKPEGDCTAWCSAFVNWCIARGRTGRADSAKLTAATRSAASQSFRSWGRQTLDPKPGDIVVLRNVSSTTQGHVGFFVSQTDDYVTMLGGNQGGRGDLDPSDSTCSSPGSVGGRVMVQRFPKRGSSLVLHSFRTDPSLHDLMKSPAETARKEDLKTDTPEKQKEQASNTNPDQPKAEPNQQVTNTAPTQPADKPSQQTPSVTPDPPKVDTTQQAPNTTPTQTTTNQKMANVNPIQTPAPNANQTQGMNSNPIRIVPRPNQRIEIALLNGRTLRVPADIDSEVLAKILAAIGK